MYGEGKGRGGDGDVRSVVGMVWCVGVVVVEGRRGRARDMQSHIETSGEYYW